MDSGAWRATVHKVTELDTTEQLRTHASPHQALHHRVAELSSSVTGRDQSLVQRWELGMLRSCLLTTLNGPL